MSFRRGLFWIVLFAGLIAVGRAPAAADDHDLLPHERLPAAPATAHEANIVLTLDNTSYVQVAHDPALNPTGDFTLEAWVWPDDGDPANCDTIVGKGYQSAYWLGLCNGHIGFYGSGASSYAEGTTDIPNHVWTHVAVVYKSSGRQYFINGELEFQAGSESAPATNTMPLRIGDDPTINFVGFDGRMANVRLWDVARSQDDIRRTMHVALVEPLPGLVASWHLNGDYEDKVGGYDGVAAGAGFVSDRSPAQPAHADVVDAHFNTLPATRYAAATTYVPGLDRVFLIGGQRSSGSVIDNVDYLDGATGTQHALSALPAPRAGAAAVYVPTTDMIYVFGGSSSSGPGGASDTIYATYPSSGATSALSATLPEPLTDTAAVYHPGRDLVYLFGGRNGSGPLDGAAVFDPAAETVTPLSGLTPPEGLYSMAAVHSTIDDALYLFAGTAAGLVDSDNVYRVTLNAAGDGGSLDTLPATLPQAVRGLRAVVDPQTSLVYLLGGLYQDWVWIFDPATGDVYRTQITLPENVFLPGVVYSRRHRHALIAGGDLFTLDNVWRLPLGDGPYVPLGRWEFPTPVGDPINAIDADGAQAVVATNGDGAYLYRSDGSRHHYTAGALSSSNGIVHNGRTVAPDGDVWLATDDAGGKLDAGGDGGSPTTYGAAELGTLQIYDVDARPVSGYQPFFGTVGQGVRWQALDFGGNPYWVESFANETIRAVVHRADRDLWVLSSGLLKHLAYSRVLGITTETNHGRPCGLYDARDLAFGDNDDWWLVAPYSGDLSVEGICRIPAADTPGAGSTVPVAAAYGNSAYSVDVDGDGRVWVGLAEHTTANGSGGLAAFEVTGGSTQVVRTTEMNWENAPLGSRVAGPPSTPTYWNSSIHATGAAEERVWAGKSDGRLITLAQRWQQLDESNDVGDRVVQDVWTARGRTFLATSSSLHVLQPDGLQWDDRSTSRVWDVLGDGQGRIWTATNTGIRLYTAAGWDYLTDREGARPATAVYALAEDDEGRVWIGGLHGLTLFDRDRFVATFTPDNAPLPDETIRALLVDGDNALWVGTDSGLARLDGADWTTFTTGDGLPADQIRDLAQTATGAIAVSTPAGLSLYDGTTFTTQSLPIPDNGLPLAVDAEGRLWAGNAVLRGDQWRVVYTTNSGLASDEVSGVATDGADRIWFAHAPDAGVSVRGTYLPPLANVVPIISGVDPLTGGSGDEIIISGSGFGGSPSSVEVTVGQGRAEVIDVTSTEITVRLTDDSTSGDVSVTVGGRRTTTTGFCAIPTVSGADPTGGNDGVRINVYGANLDPAADVFLGNNNERAPHVVDATHLWLRVRPEDGQGNLRVRNQCGDTATGPTTFRRIPLSISAIVLNQGIPSMGLVADRPTVAQFYMAHTVTPRPTDRLALDRVELTFTEGSEPPDEHVLRFDGRLGAVFPSLPGAPTDGQLADLTNSFNVVVTPDVVGALVGDADVTVTARAFRGSHLLGQTTDVVGFRRDKPLRILLVPITQNGSGRAGVEAILNRTGTSLGNLQQRMFPTGRVETYWSPIRFEAGDVLFTAGDSPTQTIDIGDTLTLYDASHNLDYARRWWNENREPGVMIAMGVVDASVNNGDATGKAFWPDWAQMLNDVSFTGLDALCDVGAFLLDLFTWGAVGDEGCDLEVPLYVGWVEDRGDNSHTIGHEAGHALSLVRLWAPNQASDNLTHSENDEVEGGTCGDVDEGASYERAFTLYNQPQVEEPIVNPLFDSDYQIRAQLNVSTTIVSTTSEAYTWRAKSTMAYPCMIGNANSYFEPVDKLTIFYEYTIAGARFFEDELTAGRLGPLAPQTTTADPPQPIPVAGQRLYVSGIVADDGSDGQIGRVNVLGEGAPLDVGFRTGWWLVQRDAGGTELARQGVTPTFSSSGDPAADDGFFGATLLVDEDTARIDLMYGDDLLDTFTAGSATPTVSLTSPTGGTYNSNAIPVTWSAADADGDDLEITVLYSADDGATWNAVAFGDAAAGSVDVETVMLAGSTQARIKVIASDGLHTAEAVSPPFTVAPQPPLPAIDGPEDGAELLEGQLVTLRGNAYDNADGHVADDGLVWSSDRDGPLGTGATLNVFLSVGTHTLTLEATNSQGASASTTVTVDVLGDYDMDGIPDAEELANGLNILTPADAFSDDDGDGVMLITERRRGTNPNEGDTDGDGRSDDEELGDGTDPATPDAPPPPNELTAFPAELVFDSDRSLGTALPQHQVNLVSSYDALTWTVTADVDWLAATRATGQTPGSTTILVNTERLPADGTYTGTLTFSSEAGNVQVPVTATIVNLPPRGLFLPVIHQ